LQKLPVVSTIVYVKKPEPLVGGNVTTKLVPFTGPTETEPPSWRDTAPVPVPDVGSETSVFSLQLSLPEFGSNDPSVLTLVVLQIPSPDVAADVRVADRFEKQSANTGNAGAVTTTLIVLKAPFANEDRKHDADVEELTVHVHPLPEADTIVPADKVSERFSELAGSGPLLVTATAYTTRLPAVTGSGESVCAMPTSAVQVSTHAARARVAGTTRTNIISARIIMLRRRSANESIPPPFGIRLPLAGPFGRDARKV
jgi:hypothetical protein